MIRFGTQTPSLKAVCAGALLLGAAIQLHAQGSLQRIYRPDGRPRPEITETRDDQALAAMKRKLASIIIPEIEFRSTTLNDAIEFLRQEIRRVNYEPNPDARDINILLQLPNPSAATSRPVVSADTGIPGLPAGTEVTGTTATTSSPAQPAANTRITLTLTRIPLGEALKYIASQAGLKVKVQPYAVSLVPLTEQTDELVTAVFRVPPNFIPNTDTGKFTSALDEPATTAH